MQIKYLKGLCVLMASAFMLNGCSNSDNGATPVTSTGTPVKVTDLTADQFAALSINAEVSGVTINSPPVVKFKVTDANGNPVVGMGNYSMTSTSTGYKTYRNLAFSIAKLVPSKDGAPSKWVNYCVTTIPTVAVPNPTIGRYPSTDANGELLDNGDGTYQYTFYRDITKVKDVIAATVDTATYKKADLGDLTYDPTMVHRVTIQISGTAPGTGTNTPTGSSAPIAAKNMTTPRNIIYDFVPGPTGIGTPAAATATRDIVEIVKCNECHAKLAFHGGSRTDTRYCVVCHTDQIKVGAASGGKDTNAEATLNDDGSGYTAYNPLTKTYTYTTATTTNKINNQSLGDFPTMVHKMHMGNKLTMKGYNWLNRAEGRFELFAYPQTVLNCTKCHENSTAAPQGDNWKTAPSRLACGSCHDNINFATGANSKPSNTKTGYVNKAHQIATSDANCGVCHVGVAAGINDTAKAHAARRTVSDNKALRTFTATILGVTVAADGKVTAKFTVADKGVAVTDKAKFSPPTFMLNKLVKGTNGAYNWVGYTNQFNTKNETMGLVTQTKGEDDGTLVANADGSFSYTFKLKTASPEGDIRNVTHAHNVAVSTKGTPGIYASDVVGTAYPTTLEIAYPVTYKPTETHRVAMTITKYYASGTAPIPAGAEATNAWFDFVPAGGAVTETRDIVKMANCAKCHENKKMHAAFDIEVCVTCHNPSTKDPYTGETVSIENIVHKIHKGIAGYAINGEDFSAGGFPGILSNCTTCHVETGNTNGANWRTNPTANACATCHTTATAHVTESVMVNNCISCHGSGAARDAQVVHQ